jgi:hypothetical protein
MGIAVLVAGGAFAAAVVGLCLRRALCPPQPASLGTMRDDFKFSIDQEDFHGDGSRRLAEPDDEFDIDLELQQQLERTRGSVIASRRLEKGSAGEGQSLLGDLSSDAQVNQEAFEEEMKKELAQFDDLAGEEDEFE